MFGQSTDDVIKVSYSLQSHEAFDSKNDIEYVVKGTPYLNKTYKILFDKKNGVESLIRYNVYRDYFELLDKNQKQTVLQKKHNINVILEGKPYDFIDYIDSGKEWSGYFSPLNEGKSILYKLKLKNLSSINNI